MSLQLYQITFDTTVITLLAKDMNQLFEMLKEKDKNFFREKDRIFYSWGKDYTDECDIYPVTMKIPIVLQWESH